MATNSLAAIWIFCGLAIVIMAIRLILGRLCRQKFDNGDKLTVVAIVFSLARIAFTHEHASFLYCGDLPSGDGSKFTLVARSLYILLLWTQQCVRLVFYRRLINDMPWGKPTLICYLVIFVITFCVSMIWTFVECHPFRNYWVVLPDPGKCIQAIVQLFVVGILNIFTDLMLIALPIPILLQVQLSLTKKLQLAFLFCIGLVIVIVTAIRIPWTLSSPDSETSRITWTTGEFLAATFVANAPTLYSFRKLFERRKNQAFRPGRSRPRVEPMQVDEVDSTVKSKTQRGAGDIVGEGSNDTGETLVDQHGAIELTQGTI